MKFPLHSSKIENLWRKRPKVFIAVCGILSVIFFLHVSSMLWDNWLIDVYDNNDTYLDNDFEDTDNNSYEELEHTLIAESFYVSGDRVLLNTGEYLSSLPEGEGDYYNYDGLDYLTIKGISAHNFKILSRNVIVGEEKAFFIWHKRVIVEGEQDHISFEKEVLDDIDTESLEFVSDNIFKDKNDVFLFQVREDERSNMVVDAIDVMTIEGADPASFKILKSPCDLEKVMCYSGTIYSRDRSNVFMNGNVILDVEVPSFEFIKPACVDDLGSTFCDIHVFYTKDSNSVFVDGKKIEGMDPDTFEFFDDPCVRDKHSVYCSGEKVSGADPDSYEVIRKYCYDDCELLGFARDRRKVYKNYTEIVPGADSKTFELLSDEYQRDKNYAYRDGEGIKGSHGRTFEVVGLCGWESFCTKDRNFVYVDGGKIEGSDPATFEIVYEEYYPASEFAKDKNLVYFGEPIKGADPKTFEIVSNELARDKDYFYRIEGDGVIGKSKR